MKKCSTCNITKPKTIEYFRKRKSSKDGFRGQCRECMSRKYKEYYDENRSEILKRGKKWRSENKEQVKRYRKEYYEDNKELLQQLSREYYMNNKEKVKLKEKRYRENNRDKIRKYVIQYRIDNPNYEKEKWHRRVSRLNDLPHTLTTGEYEDTLSYFNNECAYCGMSNEEHIEDCGENLQQDHIIPLSKGGGYVKENITPSCRTCNSSKQDFNLYDWYNKQDSYNEDRYNKILEHMRVDKN